MKISESMEKALNDQIQAELFSAYLYLGMASYLETKGLKGFAKWMEVQASEELKHAMKFYHYLFERGGTVCLKTIEASASNWDSPMAVFEAAYAHEQKVTKRIQDLMDQALQEKDYATSSFLGWFVDEQVEEESSMSDVLKRMELISEGKSSLLLLDREMGQRE